MGTIKRKAIFQPFVPNRCKCQTKSHFHQTDIFPKLEAKFPCHVSMQQHQSIKSLKVSWLRERHWKHASVRRPTPIIVQITKCINHVKVQVNTLQPLLEITDCQIFLFNQTANFHSPCKLSLATDNILVHCGA